MTKKLSKLKLTRINKVEEKPKGHHRLLNDIEKAREIESEIVSSLPKQPVLEPLKGANKNKLKPIENKPIPKEDEFDLLDLDDLVGKDDKKEDEKKEDEKKKDEKKEDKKEEDKNKKSGEIEDDYAFDFDFEDPPKVVGESKNPPTEIIKPNDAQKEEKESIEIKKNEDKSNGDKGEKDEDDWLIIEGKKYREINIEGDDNEYIMDEEGNIYDLKGVYIGTAKDGGEESEEEEDK